MKKVTVDLLLGRSSKCHFKRITQKNTIVKVSFVVGQAIKSPFISTALSKYGLNTDDVLLKINNDTKNLNWLRGIKIPTLIYISPAKTFVFEHQRPTVYALLNVIFKMDSKEITYIIMPKLKTTLQIIFYKVAIIKSQLLTGKVLQKWVSQVTGTFNSCNLYDYERK